MFPSQPYELLTLFYKFDVAVSRTSEAEVLFSRLTDSQGVPDGAFECMCWISRTTRREVL